MWLGPAVSNVGIERLSCHLPLTLLSRRLAGWMAGIRRRERLFIGVELLLSPYVDLVLRGSRKHVIQFSVVLHGCDPALGKSTDRLLLLGGGDRDDLKTRLSEQGLFLGHNVACTGGLTRYQ